MSPNSLSHGERGETLIALLDETRIDAGTKTLMHFQLSRINYHFQFTVVQFIISGLIGSIFGNEN